MRLGTALGCMSSSAALTKTTPARQVAKSDTYFAEARKLTCLGSARSSGAIASTVV